jgi:ribonuclease HII
VSDLLEYERELWERGFERIAGVDEAGRGALAGPMVAAAVILPTEFPRGQIADSKSMSPAQRELEYARVIAEAIAVSTAWMTAATVDEAMRTNALDAAHRELLRRAINALYPRPDFVLIDGFDIPNLGIESRSFPHADAKSQAVAAASVVAKITRDRAMEDLDRLFPAWGFARHKGYGGGSGEHAAAIESHGISPVHRLSYVGKHASKLRASAAPASFANPDLGKIRTLFDERVRQLKLPLPPHDLMSRTSGHLTGHGWYVQYVIREDARGPYLEYYATNRFVWGDKRARIYANGDVLEDLPTIEPLIVTRPGEDPEETKRRHFEANDRVASELREAGVFPEADINAHLRTDRQVSDEPEHRRGPEDPRQPSDG